MSLVLANTVSELVSIGDQNEFELQKLGEKSHAYLQSDVHRGFAGFVERSRTTGCGHASLRTAHAGCVAGTTGQLKGAVDRTGSATGRTRCSASVAARVR